MSTGCVGTHGAGRAAGKHPRMREELPPDIATRAFTVSEARVLGVAPARLRRVDLRSDFRGVRVASSGRPDVVDLCRSYAAKLGRDRYFSHETAAILWGMRLPGSVQTSRLVHVTTVRPARTPRARGVVGHHVDSPGHELVEHDGFLLPTPAETWRMLSTRLGLQALVVAGDGLVARQRPLCSLAQLDRAISRHAGQRGNARLRLALGLVRPGTDSARETWVRVILVTAGLPEPVVNAIVSAPGRRRRYGDLVYAEWKVIVEYEGAHHQYSRETYLDDIDRYDELEDGWRIVRLTKEHSAEQVGQRVRRALVAAGWRP